MLEIRALSKSFSEADKSVCVLDDLDLVLEPGRRRPCWGKAAVVKRRSST